MNITHLRHVAIATPEFEASRTFFTEAWGLRDNSASTNDAAYLRTQSNEAFQLALMRGPERSIERIAFALTSKADVDAAAAELSAAGVAILQAPHELTTPGKGYGLQFLDPDKRCIELSSDVAMGAPGEDGPTPQKLAHIVVNTPDIDRVTAFYTDVLGFRISDWSEHQMSFLRCNPEHHSIAFNVAPHAAYNHTSWTMSSIDCLMRAQGRVRAAGTELQWGTGRHGPGHQVFNYYIEPSGYVVELIADGIEIPDEAAWESQVWVRKPEHMDLWGTAGFPNTDVRAAMTGTPDPASERTPVSSEPRVAIVTGSGRGLGKSIAERLAKDGRHIVIAEIDAMLGGDTAAAITASGASASFFRTDIADATSLTALAEHAAAHGRIDALVNNAAIANSIGGKTYAEIDESEWDRVFRVNVKGTWLATKHIAPRIVAGGGGAVVNIASDTALWGATRLLHYISTKGAIIAMTRSLARELGPDRVTVNAVAPGLIENEATAGVPEARWNDYRSRRALTNDQTPEDIAGAVAYLCSPDATYVTGQTLVVDGGMVMP